MRCSVTSLLEEEGNHREVDLERLFASVSISKSFYCIESAAVSEALNRFQVF
jgi:hypothetical protein